MSKSDDSSKSDKPVISEQDVASLLMKMQRQLVFLEKKIDILISQAQEKPYGSNSSFEKPYRKKTFSKPFQASGPFRHHRSEDKRERSEEKGSDQVFYSKYRKSEGTRSAGSGRKPPYPKHKKRK